MSGRAVMVVGCPGSGKSTLALKLAFEEAERTLLPVLVLDPGRVTTFNVPRLERVDDLRALAYRVWEEGGHTVYSPAGEADFERIFKLVYKLGNVILLVDEWRFFANAFKVPLPAVLVTRVLRHLNVAVIGTTQSYADVNRSISSIMAELRVGRCTAPRDLERLREDFGLKPEEIGTLPQWEFRQVKVGF